MSNNSNSFVRHEMLEERAPPVGEGGVLKWVRENLFKQTKTRKQRKHKR